ncbi:MAG: hypothetical protein AB7F99_09300 [Vicinamibacterales bacterium]
MRSLEAVTLWYLALPVLMFFLGWLRLPWAAISASALVWAVSVSLDAVRRDPGSESPELHRLRDWLPPASILVLVVALCGSGGFGIQMWDWDKHNALLADLIGSPWPVAYELEATGEQLGAGLLRRVLPAGRGDREAGGMVNRQSVSLRMDGVRRRHRVAVACQARSHRTGRGDGGPGAVQRLRRAWRLREAA